MNLLAVDLLDVVFAVCAAAAFTFDLPHDLFAFALSRFVEYRFSVIVRHWIEVIPGQVDSVEGMPKAPRNVFCAGVSFRTAETFSTDGCQVSVYYLVLLGADEAALTSRDEMFDVLEVFVLFSLESRICTGH